MNFWTFVHFFCFVIYFSSVFYVIVKNPFAIINWILATVFALFAIWSACSSILDTSFISLHDADLVMKVQSLAWASFSTFYLLFILYLTNNKKLISSPLFIIPLLLMPVIFLFNNLNEEMLLCCTQVSYGMAGSWKNGTWPFIYFAFYTGVFIFSVILLIRFRSATNSTSEKKVADILLGSIAAVFTIGTFFSVVMNYYKVYNPVDANVVFLIFVGGFIYCAEKYELFTLSSPRNADRIMDLINEGILLLDNDSKVTVSNRAALELFGCTDPKATKQAYSFIEEQLKKAGIAARGSEATNSELILTGQSGAQKTFLVSSRVLLRDNISLGTICTIRDITGMKKAEVDLAETVKELERSNEELENFAYVASHDLKEPLRMVSTYVQLIRKKYSDKIGKDGNDFIGYASDGAIRMSALIDALLEYSRIRRIKEESTEVDTAAVLARILDILKFTLQDKNARVIVNGTLPVITAHGTQIEQLFMNLISNALKFTGSNPPAISVSAFRTGRFYEFVFTDNGIGFEMQYSELIFQMFKQLHKKDGYEGTGMGLAICRKIVESHGGTIRAISEGPGKGCSFIFTLLA